MWAEVFIVCFSTELVEVISPDRFKGMTEPLGEPERHAAGPTEEVDQFVPVWQVD